MSDDKDVPGEGRQRCDVVGDKSHTAVECLAYDEQEPGQKETLLHLVMKLGLVKLSLFLAVQPEGPSALALPNKDGATPLDWALQNGHSKLVEIFPSPVSLASDELSQDDTKKEDRREQADEEALQYLDDLRYANTQNGCAKEVPFVVKEDLNPLIFSQKLSLNNSDTLELHGTAAAAKVLLVAIVLILGEFEHRHSTFDVLRKLKSPPTLFAATRLSPMLSGSDEVYANCMVVDQAGDLKTNYSDGDGGSSEMCLNPTSSIPMAKSSSSPSLEENDQFIYLPNEESQSPVKKEEKSGLRHAISPSHLYVADSYPPFKTHGFIRDRGQLYADMKRRRGFSHIFACFMKVEVNRYEEFRDVKDFVVFFSSSLDDLEVDNGSGGVSDRSHVHYPPLSSSEAMASSRDGLDFPAILQPKECAVFGIRSRSYSCSSPKGLVGRRRIPRDFAAGDSNGDSLPGDISQMVLSSVHPSFSVPIGLSPGKREASQQPFLLSKSVPSASLERRAAQFSEPDSETSTWRLKSQSEEMLQALGTFSSMDAFMMEDGVDLSQWTDLCTDAEEFEAESWSLAVDPVFCSKQEKDVVKRQDVIFGQYFKAVCRFKRSLVYQIEREPTRSIADANRSTSHPYLLIMSEIFRKGMKEELQLDHSTVDRIFPCLDELLEMHRQFFCRMKDRRQESCEAGSERNFVISRIGDILVQQFSEENATKMEKTYGEFCSHQKEAVNLFKELQQNKKFQNFIKLRNSNLLARRRGIPECILLVTQRITKYPVLVERILQYSKEGTEEHKDLCKALRLIKDVITAVDLKVNDYEKKQKLLEILCRTENKTYTKMKNGHVFRKQDLMRKERILLHEGLVYWKTATGRFKDTLALLLTDVLLFLQEKDQKYIFAAVDQKPSVISLQKLIVREVANEERGMFLISASSAGPEMYEIHTSSKEERNNWMRHIQEAVESCPEEEEEDVKMSESDEDRRIAEAKAYRIQKYQESLNNQDQQICSYLEEKLRIYAELGDMCGFDDVHVEPHLLIKPDSGETPQAAPLLAAALREVESLHVAVTSSQVSESDTSPEESTEELSENRRFTANEILESIPGDAERKEIEESPEISLSVEKEMAGANLEDKAALAIQDSHRELHKLLLQESEKTGRSQGSRLNLVLEQEKYRNLEKQRVEPADIHKLKQQFQQEQQRWLRECDQRQREQGDREGRLEQRERECQCQEELLEQSRQGLALQLQEYQQSLERLQEGQQMVERERDSVKMQKKLVWHWKHGQQNNLLSRTGDYEIMGHNQLDSLHGENTFYFNEAVVCVSLSRVNRSDSSLVYEDGVYGMKISNSDVAETSENQVDLKMDTSCQPALTSALWKSTGPYQMSFSCKGNKDDDLSAPQTQGPQTSIPNQGSTQSPQVDELLLNHQPESLQDAESGARVEEKIVYL
ncbi:hypothetical protein DUI87_06743 [Hirundo rustica rustica]|uniref:Rho guanine nucleotide exchange factor 28 n=1 Tax=Hirundo rustica rustica TaxID=333673 RepID=A0A3M0KY64_HIRRU|nr:hypothetical protein DUI87_06743 [Hirundo rustica rustica]